MENKDVPFLIEKAEHVPHDSEVINQFPESSFVATEWFHTRCGHPRRRDD